MSVYASTSDCDIAFCEAAVAQVRLVFTEARSMAERVFLVGDFNLELEMLRKDEFFCFYGASCWEE